MVFSVSISLAAKDAIRQADIYYVRNEPGGGINVTHVIVLL